MPLCRCFSCFLPALLLYPVPAPAQGRLGGGSFRPWAPTKWSLIEVRVKCDGALPFTGGSPTSWRVQFKNRSERPASFDVTVSAVGVTHQLSTRRTTIKPGAMREVQVELPSDCAAPVQIAIDRVRLGDDRDSTAYVPVDRPGG